MLDQPALATDADYVTMPDRVRNRDRLLALVRDILATRPRAYWLARMRDAGVPGGAINSVAEAFDGAEIAQRGLVTTIPHATAGTIPNVALSIRLHGTPLADPVAAPRLGQHTTQVLRDLLGYDAERIQGLVDCGVVRQAAGT